MKSKLAKYPAVLALLLFSVISLKAQDAEITHVADYLAKTLSAGPHRTVAVVDLSDLGSNVTPLGQFLAEDLEGALVNSANRVDVVDRSRLQLLIKENKLAWTGVIDPSTARQLGKIAGADVLITGTITPFGDTVSISIKALDTEDGRVLAAISESIPKTPQIVILLGQSTVNPPASSATNPVSQLGRTVSTPGQVPPSTQTPYRPPDSAPVGASTTQSSMPMVTEEQQVSFELTTCIYSGRSVKCDLTIINSADDRDFLISAGWGGQGRTKIYDDQGLETLVGDAKLGSHVQGDYGVNSTLISGIATHAQLVFENVSPSISFISKLEIGCRVPGKDFSVSFKKIPLSSRR